MDELDTKERWRILEHVAASDLLKRASRLREFLFYVGDRSIREGCTDIHEQEIGHRVFGRQEFYDTSQDNIVRVNATELRKRIDAYFTSDGIHEPLVFEIPRGSYAPIFRQRTQEIPVVEKQETPAAEKKESRTDGPEKLGGPEHLPNKRSTSPWLIVSLGLVSIVALLLAVTCVTLWRDNQNVRRLLHPWRNKPVLSEFWSRFLDSPRETNIVLADTSFALVEDIMRQSLPLDNYLNRSYMWQIQSSNFSTDRREDLNLIASRPNGSEEDFQVAEQIQALDPVSSKLSIKFAREFTADSMKRNNVILIGGQKSNPWANLFFNQLNFTIQYDPNLMRSFIDNRNPKSGEQARYIAPASTSSSVGYSIVAFLPNPSHTADALIIAGTDSEATNAAGEFITSEDSLQSFLKRMHTKNIPYFEILLKTTRLNGTPFSAQLLSYRIY